MRFHKFLILLFAVLFLFSSSVLSAASENKKVIPGGKQALSRVLGLNTAPFQEFGPHRHTNAAVPTVTTVSGNDSCSSAIAVNEGTWSDDNTAATTDGADTCVSSSAKDVWYAYTATVTGNVAISTQGSYFDTVLSVHDGCPGDTTNEIACNDDTVGLSSTINLNVTSGTTYLIRVAGFSDSEYGPYTLSIGSPSEIEGTITDAEIHTALQDVYVILYDVAGNYSGYTFTNNEGEYSFEVLPGDYHLAAWSFNGYIRELYDDVTCPLGNCDISSGTTVSVGADTTVTADFALTPGGRISGSVQGDGAPSPYAEVDIFDSQGEYVLYGYADETGSYITDEGLPAGTYYAAAGSYGFYPQLYEGLPFNYYSDPTSGTSIDVTLGATTSGINFDLPPWPLYDHFDDGVITDWTSKKGTWTEHDHSLYGSSSKKADIFSPVEPCQNYAASAEVRLLSKQDRVWFFAWYQDANNYFAVILEGDKNRVVFKHVSGGAVVFSTASKLKITKAQSNWISLFYDPDYGFDIFVDNHNGSIWWTYQPGIAPLPGKFGFRVQSKGGTAKIATDYVAAY